MAKSHPWQRVNVQLDSRVAMAKSHPWQRVNVQLDSRVALEANILNRLKRLPASRRQEWLRGLLVQGLLAECQILRSAAAETTRHLTWRPKHLRAGKVVQPIGRVTPVTTAVSATPSTTSSAGKPFAALGQVIGGAHNAAIDGQETEDPKP